MTNSLNLNAGAFIIFDDANAVTKSDLMPVAVANDFRAGLAVFHAGIASGYEYVTLPEVQEWRRTVNGEVFSHSMNSVALTTAYDASYRNSLIESSQREFSQMGFNPRGFVAPSSTLAVDSRPTVREMYDFAFLRSAKFTTNAGAVNAPGADRWNLVRISLEPSDTNPAADMTLDRAKQFVDYANETGGYICFYTHTYLDWLPELMQYIKSNCPNITPSEWVGRNYGLTKNTAVLPTGNFIKNTSFERGADNEIVNWKINTSELLSVTQDVTLTNELGILSIRSMLTNKAGAAGYLHYKHITGPIKAYAPMCFSINASSSLPSNTRVTLSMSLVAVDGTILRKSPVRSYVISANRPTIYVNDGFCLQPAKEVDASYVLIEIKFEAINDGQVVVILHSPKLERAGLPTPFSK